MRIDRLLLSVVCLVLFGCSNTLGSSAIPTGATATKYLDLNPREIQRIAQMLPTKPVGIGPTCANRQVWGQPALQKKLKPLVDYAQGLINKPFPAWSDDAYLTYSRTGSRGEGEDMMNARFAWLYPLVMAECAEAKGRFLPSIEKTIVEISQQPSWILPADDDNLRFFHGKQYQVDLLSSDLAHDLAQDLYMLGAWIKPETRSIAMQALQTRVFEPMLQTLKTGQGHGWLRYSGNANAVCMKGLLGAALTVLDSAQERAVFVAAAQRASKLYLSGFPDDGYSMEGIGYWNYGFSHFVLLRDLIMHQTDRQLDLFADKKVRAVALYGYRIEMRPNTIAAFGDSSPVTRLDRFTIAYLNAALGLGDSTLFARQPIDTRSYVGFDPLPTDKAATILFTKVPPVKLNTGRSIASVGFSSYFPTAGVLVSRSGVPDDRLAITIAAGGKDGKGFHSHNDIGSYSIAVDDEQPVGDVGKTQYTSKTFSSERYTIRAINSYGHPVPVVAGQLQQEASKLPKIQVLAKRQTPVRDLMSIDLRPAYQVDGLKSLTRKMVHDRATDQKAAQIVIEDRFAYNTPKDFETALTTLGTWQQESPNTLIVTGKQKSLRVKISASAAWTLKPETITEEGLTFTRLGIALQKPSIRGFIKMTFSAL